MKDATPRLLMIDDNPDYGGHQVMTAYALEGLLSLGEWNVLALIDSNNHNNFDRLSKIQVAHPGRLELETSSTRSRKFQAVLRHLYPRRLQQLRERILAFRPDVVLVIQGNIEQGCSAFLLRGQTGCPILSYIPVPHKHREMGAKLGAIRDLTCRYLYDEPDGFIVISETLAGMLRRYGATGRIKVVENGIPLEPFHSLPDQVAARKSLGLPEKGFIWGQIGRTEFKQKGQDFALSLFQSRAEAGEYLVFLGSGPDSELLDGMVEATDRTYTLPWSDQPHLFYAAVDALLLPSRYEGVPLAMLEALANEVPVAATNRDGMCDWLPEAWRFKYRDLTSGMAAMAAARAADPTQIRQLKQRVWDRHTIHCFQQNFLQTLSQWL